MWFSDLEEKYTVIHVEKKNSHSHLDIGARRSGAGQEVTRRKYTGDLTVVSPAFCALVHRLAVSTLADGNHNLQLNNPHIRCPPCWGGGASLVTPWMRSKGPSVNMMAPCSERSALA